MEAHPAAPEFFYLAHNANGTNPVVAFNAVTGTIIGPSGSVPGVAASPATKFFIGLSSFQIGLDALQNAQKLGADKGKDAKESKLKACAEAKVAEDQWATAQVAIVQGAAYNKEGAGQIMSNIQQYSEYIPQMKKAYCPK